MHSIALNLEPEQYLSGWHPESGSVFLPTLSEARVGDEVAARIGIYGQAIRATIFGTVGLVRRVGRPALRPGVEVMLDPASLPAAGFLAMAARGEPVTFKERPPRFTVERRLLVQDVSRSVLATVNVSTGGCSVRWAGPLPLVGDVLPLRLADGIFAPSARGIVCWNQPGGEADRLVGLRLAPAGRAGRAWRTIVEQAARSGARAS